MVFVAMLLANFCILILGYVQTKVILHLLRIPFRLLGSAILLIAVVGAYALRNLVLDVWVVFVAGISSIAFSIYRALRSRKVVRAQA